MIPLRKIQLLCMTILLCIASFAQNIPPKPSKNRFVYDYIDLLSKKEVAKLQNKLRQYEKSSTNQIAIVIIKSLGKFSLEEYALKWAETWGIGQKNKNNGILLLLAFKDKKVRIEVGYGLESKLTDSKSKQIIRNNIGSNFKQKKYYQGLSSTIAAMIKALEAKPKPMSKEDITQKRKYKKIKQFVKELNRELWVDVPNIFTPKEASKYQHFLQKSASAIDAKENLKVLILPKKRNLDTLKRYVPNFNKGFTLTFVKEGAEVWYNIDDKQVKAVFAGLYREKLSTVFIQKYKEQKNFKQAIEANLAFVKKRLKQWQYVERQLSMIFLIPFYLFLLGVISHIVARIVRRKAVYLKSLVNISIGIWIVQIIYKVIIIFSYGYFYELGSNFLFEIILMVLLLIRFGSYGSGNGSSYSSGGSYSSSSGGGGSSFGGGSFGGGGASGGW